MSSRNATLTGSNESWRGNPFLKQTNFRNSQLSRPGNTQVPFYLNHLPVFCSICYRYSNVRSPRTQNQRWFASPYVIIEDFIAKSCLSLYEKTKIKTISPGIHDSFRLKKKMTVVSWEERGDERMQGKQISV